MRASFLPGSTLGILGGGQLGKMTAQVAQRMGYRVHVFAPESHSVAGIVADAWTNADYLDEDALSKFIEDIDVCTLEFENIPTPAVNFISKSVEVCPGEKVLYVAQDRIREKELMQRCGIPVAPFHPVRTDADLDDASSITFPAILKTARDGYDGKGQRVVNSSEDLAAAWDELDRKEAVLEQRINLAGEFSVLVARNGNGSTVCYEPIENHHQNQILDLSIAPSSLPQSRVKEATEFAITIADEVELVGLICVEFFLDADGLILVNEIAPRPHNSGHLTIEGHVTSQFEQQVRAVCGLPLGPIDLLSPTAMVNLLGDLWEQGTPDWEAVMAIDKTHLHLYGKPEARPGRKMGHLTSFGNTRDEAKDRAINARTQLKQKG